MERAKADLQAFKTDALWAFVARQQARSPEPQRRFVERWLQRVSHGDAKRALDDSELRSLIEMRERELNRITSYNVCYTKLLRGNRAEQSGAATSLARCSGCSSTFRALPEARRKSSRCFHILRRCSS